MDVSDLALELKSRENMDDSDLALERAVQLLDRESESSDIEVDSQADCSVYSDGVVNNLDLYTPSVANPAYGVCRRGSLLNSGSEDSASKSSFCTDSDAGPARSAVYCRQSRGMASGRPARCAVSDSETRPRKLGRFSGASLNMNDRVPVEDFALRIRERLLAVSKDREAMTQKVRDLARQKGYDYDEIMAVEWYELPEACKYLMNTRSTTRGQEPRRDTSCNGDMTPPSRLTISPSELTPCSTVSLGSMGISKLSSGKRMPEVTDAMRGLQVNQVTRKRSHRNGSGSNSVLSATSDSGVGDNWATSGLTTPSNDRLRAYLHGQNMLSTSLQPREREAQAAAIALISNSPQPESLNPIIPLNPSRQQHRHHHQRGGHSHEVEPHHHQSRQHGLACHCSSGDDSSSVFTMTSQSSTSDLFIPRKAHQHIYTDSEDQHHFANNRYRRMLSTPKRSNHMKHGHPSPLSEQHRQQLPQQRPIQPPPQSPRPSEMMLSPPPQHPISHTSGAGGGTVHVIYHLDDIPTPYYAKWNNGIAITLRVFKERVFARKGDYRFFFESFNPDLNMSLLEEFTEEDICLPVVRGKIIGRVEKAQ